MKKICYSKILSAVVFSGLCTTICHAKSTSYTCLGMSSNGDKINSTLTLVSTENPDVYQSLWTYDKPGSTPDKGVVRVVGKDRMVELSEDHKGIEKGQADLYQISDKQIVISYESFSKKNKHKNAGVCNLVP